MTLEEAVDFCKNNPEAAAHIIITIERTVEELKQRIKELEDKLDMDSTNSSKPPSTDSKLTNKKNPKTKKSKRRRGAQKGHKGNFLKLSENPDTTNMLLPYNCTRCNKSLDNVNNYKIDKRQVYDLPEIKVNVTEYQAHSKICPCCNTINKPKFPNHIKATTQYGENLKSFVSYCNTYQMLPYERITELINDIASHKISTGTINNFLKEYYRKLEKFEIDTKVLLKGQEVFHSDETGANIQGDTHWIHVVSSQIATLYMVHKKRGKEAINYMDILPDFKGILVHDHFSSYSSYNCKHSYCNAHILRELNGISEKESVQWSKDLHILLTTMNNEVHKAKNSAKFQISVAKTKSLIHSYKKITQSAFKYYPPPDKKVKKPGRTKQAKGKNLLDRLVKYEDETLRFLVDFRVPFTNNLAERDLRMIKVKEKISGCFASFNGGEMFCRIRSYISTLKKNDMFVLQGLKNALAGKAYVPVGG
jgi:transposase